MVENDGRIVMRDQGAETGNREELKTEVAEAAGFLKALSHSGRLLIMCHLAEGEKSVNELEAIVGIRQAAVSQQLARLRHESMVTSRRQGKMIYYSLADERARRMVGILKELFCKSAL